MLKTTNRVGFSLQELLPEARIFGASDVRISSCSGNAADCQTGDLFVAIVGADRDGHDDVAEAIDRGAVALLTERPLVAGVPVCVVEDTREAYGQICHKLAGAPAQHLRVVGVTGTRGKTGASMLIASVLEAGGRGVGFTSSLGHSDGVTPAAAKQTTPPAPQLATWLARMAANGCTDAVVELSSDALAQRRASGLELDAAVLTNLRHDHLDVHGSIINYRRAKARIFDRLKPDGFAVINNDDDASRELLEGLDHPTITIAMHSDAEVTGTVIERTPSEQTFLLSAGRETAPVRTRMIGDQHVYNCLTAAAVGLVCGIDLPTVVRGIENLSNLPGRLERIECGQSFGVYVDNANSPQALAAVLQELRQVTSGRILCVYGAEGERNQEQRAMLGRVVEKGADWGVITNHNPRFESHLQIAHDILDGFEEPEKAHLLPDRAEAIYLALDKAQPGDTVLIAGKGHESVQHVCGKAHPFDDRETAKQWLYETAESTPATPTIYPFSIDSSAPSQSKRPFKVRRFTIE